MRQTHAAYFNNVQAAWFDFCQLNGNTLSGTGGALMDAFDNLPVQSSSLISRWMAGSFPRKRPLSRNHAVEMQRLGGFFAQGCRRETLPEPKI